MSEIEKLAKVLEHYRRGALTREEYYDQVMVVWSETTPAPRVHNHPWQWVCPRTCPRYGH